MKFTTLALMCCIALASCNGANANKQQAPQQVTQDKQVAQDKQDKQSEQYIRQRLTDIYAEAFRDKEHDLMALDAKFMSQEYNQLQNRAMAIAEKNDDMVIDADHWVQGQDWTYPTMDIKRIDNITNTTVTAHVIITTHMPGCDSQQTELTLPLVYERGDWFIDNMQQYYEGELLDEKAWYKDYVEHNK